MVAFPFAVISLLTQTKRRNGEEEKRKGKEKKQVFQRGGKKYDSLGMLRRRRADKGITTYIIFSWAQLQLLEIRQALSAWATWEI